ncbi:putative sec63 Brl domain containing protein [Lyophyllum shimeji]|uniref:Sec63 Brl domain containing protein n=1 Tax=Lyophyllum shimeji TaxID=47721 RepID=A0A9P3UJS5_LYOSH|nr:putative sec63 Brl domain containing protein [Lyophyllum shimeji]
MSKIVSHLEFLVGSSRDTADTDRHVLEDWETLQKSVTGLRRDQDVLTIEDEEVERWPSVLDSLNFPDIGVESAPASNELNHYSPSTCVARLLQKPNVTPLLDSLHAILASTREDDVVSGEIAEIVGFDDIELVMDILSQRTSVAEELEQLGRQAKYTTAPAKPLHDLSQEEARRRMEKAFREKAERPLFSGIAQPAAEILPHVYSSTQLSQGNILSQFGSKYMLPIGTVRNMHEEFEEVIIPPAKTVPPKAFERLLPVEELDPLARQSFPGYTSLNRIQSIVYPTAYRSNENLLICAPTGAGKTDVAMLTILRVIDQHRVHAPLASNGDIKAQLRSTVNRDAFKIIYVAPMKALASEIVRKLAKRLSWLSIQVRELTGDMQMTKAEIAQTQIIVTTPEKWDVVTRKPTGEGELASSLKLLIIDEVHLLNEERGAVIETIVARTLRQVESSQSMIRIVGLSATLPNYMDVAEFLSVSKYKGLFYFDSSFRPVPLEQHFLGIKGKPGSAQSRKNLDRVTFLKVSELVAQGHQVMVFVHARKETVKTAMALREAAVLEGNIDDFSCQEHPQWALFRRSIGESRNKEMKQLFDAGFGIHHAGMLRSDRNMMERMFEARAIKVLCCTATLAWGVNLPAHAVIIKGTQVYDSSKGAFVDLSVLDVLQVFGRAGRPGLEASGEGYICTTEDKLTHYLDAVTSQIPIESQFQRGLIDSLNAEISLGTVANTSDAVRWLGYTYLFVRMRKNPFIYGIARDASGDDPQLGNKRHELVTIAAQKLADAHMITFDRMTGAFTITDLGRIAAKYYIRHSSIEIFNKEFRPKMSEADVLAIISMSTEFEQIQVRESEGQELEALMERVPCDVKGGADTSQGKANILLQGAISREMVEDFALVSDMAYVMQNGGRIVRALLEIAISRKWANVTAVLMGISKAIEKRLWPFDQPLKQFDLRADIFYGLQEWADDWSVAQLATLDAESLGRLVHLNVHHGQALLNAAKQFPAVQISYDLRPLGADVLKIAVRVQRAFTWNVKVHGTTEPLWLWVEDHEGLVILQLAHLIFRHTTATLNIDFVISIPNGIPPPSVTIRYVSDRWMGAEDEILVPLESLVMPIPSTSNTPLLDLPLLSTSIVKNPTVENMISRRIAHFNAIQTQTYWSLINTKCHALLSAPVGSGKSTMAHILALMFLSQCQEGWVLIIAPRRSVASETLAELRATSKNTGIAVEYDTGPNALSRPRGRVIRVLTTAHLLQVISKRDPMRPLLDLDIVVCENLELLDSTYELAISLLRHATQSSSTRFVGLSDSLNDASDLADWLDVDPSGLHSFRPSDRDQSLRSSTQTFTIPQSAALFKAMAKPAHAAIQSAALGESAIIFVPSRGLCKAVALDLLTQCALEMETERGYLPPNTPPEYLEDYLVRLQDSTLIDFVSKGVGFFHEGINKADRNLILGLYAEGIIRVLVVPRDSCWTLPVRATVVVVMGTQYVHVEAEGTDRQLRDYELTELVRMQSRAVRHTGSGYFYLFCQTEAKDTFTRFLNEGLPLESQLLETDDLARWYDVQKERAGALSEQDALDALSFTFLARRVVTNPAYYGSTSTSRDENLSRIVDKVVIRAGGLRPASTST